MISKILEKLEYKSGMNRYENNEIDIETLDKLFAARTDEFVQHVKDLALAKDEELKEKMSFIINADLETF